MLAHEFNWNPQTVANLDPSFAEEVMRFIKSRNKQRADEQKEREKELKKANAHRAGKGRKGGSSLGPGSPSGSGKFKRKVNR